METWLGKLETLKHGMGTWVSAPKDFGSTDFPEHAELAELPPTTS